MIRRTDDPFQRLRQQQQQQQQPLSISSSLRATTSHHTTTTTTTMKRKRRSFAPDATTSLSRWWSTILNIASRLHRKSHISSIGDEAPRTAIETMDGLNACHRRRRRRQSARRESGSTGRRVRLAIFMLSLLFLASSAKLALAGIIPDPYKVLGLSPYASPKEIQKQYRKLCLKYHPDKTVHLPKSQREKYEVQFKRVQEAYSMVANGGGGGAARQQHYTNGTTGRQQSTPYGSDPISEAFFRAFDLNGRSHHRSGSSQFFYRTPSSSFGSFRTAFPSSSTAPPMMPAELSFKSIYVQKVKVPLEKLYTGVQQYPFTLHDNLWTRYKAAWKGKILFLSLYQGLLYSAPMIRINKVFAAVVGLFIMHSTLPRPSPGTTSYTYDLKPGSKGGMTLKYASTRFGQPEVIFDVVEEPHAFFERKGNDLYGTLVLSSQDAREGCIKRITALDPSEDPITIVIPPHKYSYEQQLRQRQREKGRLRTKKEKTTPVPGKSKNSSYETNDDDVDDEEYDRLIKIPGRGWPTGNADLKGDVILSVRVKIPRHAQKILRQLSRDAALPNIGNTPMDTILAAIVSRLRGGGDSAKAAGSSNTAHVLVGLIVLDGQKESSPPDALHGSLFMLPSGISLSSNTTITSWKLDTEHESLLESMALLCDVLIIASSKEEQPTKDHDDDDDGPTLLSTSLAHRMSVVSVPALKRGVQRRIDAGLGRGSLLIVSPHASDRDWIQQQVVSELFSKITPEEWEVFDFVTGDALAMVIPSELSGSKMTDLIFPAENPDDLVVLVPKLHLEVLMKLNVSKIQISYGNTTAVADAFTSLQDLKQPFIETLQQNVSSISTDPVMLGDGANIVIEEVLSTAYEQLGALELKMEEVALEQAEGYAMPLLDFGSTAQRIIKSTKDQLQSLEDSGKVSSSFRRDLTAGIRKQVQRLYNDQLQALRNYYGQRYESILEKTTAEGGVSIQAEREWATSAEHMTQGFRAAAQNSVPSMFCNEEDERDFAHVEALQGLVKDMIESTERRKDVRSLSAMALGDDENENTGIGKRRWWKVQIPKWMEKIAARAFVFGVNYLQGWLAWQGIKRAALERDRLLPKFPLF